VNLYFVISLCCRILAYLVILTENTTKVTVAEENGPGPLSAGKDGFLSVMGDSRRDRGEIGRITESPFTFQSVDSTIPGTDITGRQSGFKPFNPLS